MKANLNSVAFEEANLPSPVFNRKNRAKLGANHKQKRLVVLNKEPDLNDFEKTLARNGKSLRKSKIEILQINLGKVCNLTCEHCHVEAGPNRTESMSKEHLERLLELARELEVSTLDLTGGAPEMAPGFRDFLTAARRTGCEVIVRSNLTILLEEGYRDLPQLFAREKVRVIASLPCYSEENVDKQRGDGVFEQSIAGLKALNAVGYGHPDSGLLLDLVYNPLGASLPGPQKALENAYKRELKEKYGIVFNALFAITNIPIGRFYSDLKKQGKAEDYDRLLADNFNPKTVDHLMCRNTLNISWDGWVYDCDFNQMIEMPMINKGRPIHISDKDALVELEKKTIQTGDHCFGCTAGAGSSCGGSLE